MKTSKIPAAGELARYAEDRKAGAEKYGVTQKTMLRWLRQYHLCPAKGECSSHRLDMDKAIEIRKRHEGGESMKDLAAAYNVTISTISRIVHNVTYRHYKEAADISVIYNPNPSSSCVVGAFQWAGGADGTP